MWIVTKTSLEPEKFTDGKVLVESVDNVKGTILPFSFRMKDDDGNIYFWGSSDDNDSEDAFRPLDEYGRPGYGCTTIEYLNKGKWELL